MEKILVALDGSEHSQKSLAITAALAKQYGSDVILAHVTTNEQPSASALRAVEVEYPELLAEKMSTVQSSSKLPNDAQYVSSMLAQERGASSVINSIIGERLLNDAQRVLEKMGVVNVKSLLLKGDPAEEIIKAVEAHTCDTVVMGCRGVSKFKGIVMGSVSQAVAHEASGSVIIVK